MNERIKALYEEANRLHVQAKGILAEFTGKEMPVDKRQEVDTLLDQMEAKSEEAKSAEKQGERLAAQDRFLNDPATRKNFFQDKEQNGDGQVPDAKVRRQQAWLKFAGKGLDYLTEAEFKDLSVGVPTAGGYLTVDTWLGELVTLAKDMSAMRRISRTLPPVPVGSVIAPAEDTALSDATWTTEILTGAADAVGPFGDRKLTPHPLAKRVLVSNDLMRNPSFDVEAFVRDRMAYKFAVPEEEGFVNGNGVNCPKGVLQTTGLSTYTTAAAITLTADDVINWVYSLPATYAARARILCNRSFIRKCRTLKDGVGNYVWQAGLQSGIPNSILDTPYDLSDRVATGLAGTPELWVTTSVVAVIGDFSYYWIADALGMSIQRLVELYAATNQTGFIGRKQTDGLAVRAQAFYSLTIQ